MQTWPGLSDNIIKLVKPIYERLSKDDLLERRLDGKTQNQSESLNGMIWNRLPKEVFIGSDVLKLGIYYAVAHFNIGSQAALNVLEIDPGTFCLAELHHQDQERVHKAESKAQEENKRKEKSGEHGKRRMRTNFLKMRVWLMLQVEFRLTKGSIV